MIADESHPPLRIGRRATAIAVCLVGLSGCAVNPIALAGDQLVPARLLAYTTVDGARLLCAVPTDVQPEDQFYGASPASGRAVFVEDPTAEAGFGAITCAFEVSGSSGKRRYVIGGRHVFSPEPEIGGRAIASGIEIAPLVSVADPPGAQVIGRTEPYGGVIRDHLDPSFDVQLASVAPSSWATVREMLEEMPLSRSEPYIASAERFEEIIGTRFFEILVPDNHPDAGTRPRATLSATFETILPSSFAFDYLVRVNGTRRSCLVSHWELLKFAIANERVPLGGDSGSPVVCWLDDGTCTLAGMHIAGREDEPVSLAIPSWQLFEVDNYLALPRATRIRPINI